MRYMPADIDIDIWESVFEQTPVVWRWVFGVLTIGLFTLATAIYKTHKNNMDRIEKQIHARVDRLESTFNERLGEMNKHLIEIAKNTRK